MTKKKRLRKEHTNPGTRRPRRRCSTPGLTRSARRRTTCGSSTRRRDDLDAELDAPKRAAGIGRAPLELEQPDAEYQVRRWSAA